jgi:hypothetical protein
MNDQTQVQASDSGIEKAKLTAAIALVIAGIVG